MSTRGEVLLPPHRARRVRSQEKPRSSLAFAFARLGFPWLFGPEKAKKRQPKPRKAKVGALEDKTAPGLRRHAMPVVRASTHGLDSAARQLANASQLLAV
jgi:hypothetical protein